MHLFSLVRRHAAAIWAHRWKGLAVAWVVCIVGWAVVQVIPSQYQASARIYADADAVLGTLLRGLALDSSPAGEVDTLQRTLLSRPNLERVIQLTDLERRTEFRDGRDALVDRLIRNIKITNQTRNLFTVSYRHPDPEIARDVVQATVDIFMEAATGSDRRQFENAREFLLQQITFYEGRLREAENRRAEFQARYVDLLPSEAHGGRTRLETARGRLADLRGELEDARTRRELTRQQLDAAPAYLTAEAAAGQGGQRLADAERTLRELRLRLTEEHPSVVMARNLVAQLRSNGGGTGGGRGDRPNPMHEQLRGRMVDSDVEVTSLERRVREAEAEVERLDAVARSEPELLAQYTNLDRDYTVLRRQYEELLARRESIRIADAARTDSDRVKLEVIDPAQLPSDPSWPNRPLFSAGVLLVGMGAGFGLALLLSRMDGMFYTVHDLRRIGLPVLGAISASRRPARSAASALSFALACLLLIVAFGAVVAGPENVVTALLARDVA